MVDLVRNVTAENYEQLGSDFIALCGGVGFVIALADGQAGKFDYHQTLKQWGAWYAFFVRIKHRADLMRKREFYTVPAEWPHVFTSDSSVQLDAQVGEEFERRWLERRAGEREGYSRAVDRVAQATAAKARMRTPKEMPADLDLPW